LGVDTNEKPKVEPLRKPVVIAAAERRYKHPAVKHVGPVRSGSLREFEDEEPTS
jgi:hypothetical protein